MIRYKPRLLPQSEMGKHSSLAQGSRHPLLPLPSRHIPGRRRPGSGGPAGSHPLGGCGDSRRIVAGRGRVERKAEPTAFLRRGTNVPWVTLAPCGPSRGFSFLPLVPNGPRVGCRDAARAPRAGTQLGPGLARLPTASPARGSYPPSEPCRLQGRTRGLRRPGKALPPGVGCSGRDASRLPGKARPPHPARRRHPQHPQHSRPPHWPTPALQGRPAANRGLGAGLRAPPDDPIRCGPPRLGTELPRPPAARPGGRSRSCRSRYWEPKAGTMTPSPRSRPRHQGRGRGSGESPWA